MNQTDDVYTTGMNEDEVDEKLQASEHGVLSLAADEDAYATPMSCDYDGDRLLLKVSTRDDESEKRQFIETTLDEWFPPFRLFDEAVEDLQFVPYELEMETAIGRKTVKSST